MSRKPQQNAVIAGAGFCGLAVCYHLLLKGWSVDLYDPKGIGKGASGIAAGLVHPFAGENAKKSLEADEGMRETVLLIEVAEKALGRSVRTSGGIIRPALNAAQVADYAKCAEKHPKQVRWDGEVLWVEEGFAVHTDLYLEGLWMACKQLGVRFHQKKAYDGMTPDVLIWATGADMSDRTDVVVTKVRGQLLEVLWPENHPPLKLPLSSKVYAVMGPENDRCIVGSTYERDRTDSLPDVEFASREILPKIYRLLPFLEGMPILECRAGVRASTPGHRPLLKQLSHNVYAIGGMGSKGLLYHALYAKKLLALIPLA